MNISNMQDVKIVGALLERKRDFNMSKAKYQFATRNIKVMHPAFPEVVLFEAQVRIMNLNKKIVKTITKIDIQYDLHTN